MAGSEGPAPAGPGGETVPPRQRDTVLERRHGAVLNVASTAAFQPGPNQAVYCATKAYVLSFTEALAEEVRGSGVRVSCLAPGATRTEFAAQAGMTGTRAFKLGVMGAGPVAQAG